MLQALKRFLFADPSGVSFHGIKFPSVEEARWMTNQVFHSPDLGYLEQAEFQLLFVPDDMRLGYSHHSLIEESVPLAGGYTQNTFAYWVQTTEKPNGDVERIGIPLRQDGPHIVQYFAPPLKIKGEVHAVRSWQFQRTDEYKRNTKQFRRQRMNILVPYRVKSNFPLNPDGTPYKSQPVPLVGKNYQYEAPEKVYVLRCYMYVAMPEYWNNLLDAGFRGIKPVNRYESRRSWLKEYYDFPKVPHDY